MWAAEKCFRSDSLMRTSNIACAQKRFKPRMACKLFDFKESEADQTIFCECCRGKVVVCDAVSSFYIIMNVISSYPHSSICRYQ